MRCIHCDVDIHQNNDGDWIDDEDLYPNHCADQTGKLDLHEPDPFFADDTIRPITVNPLTREEHQIISRLAFEFHNDF